jgi:iron(III) transport system permease protein
MATNALYVLPERSWLAHRVPPEAWLVALLVAAVVWLIVPPLAILVYGSATDTPPAVPPHFTFDTLRYAFGRYRIWSALANSALYAAATASLVLVIGGFLAWLVERTDSRVRRFADLFTLAPILMPSVLLISGWILLLGPKSGMVNLIARDWFGVSEPVLDIYSFWGMVWVGTLQELPLAFLWLWPAFRAMNPDLEEAALVAGADFLTTMRRITLPMLRPTILGAWIIFFIYSLGALSVPLLIGLPAKVFLYSTEIYLAYRRVPSDLNIASAYSLVFLLVTVLSIWAYRRATADSARFVTVTGKAFRPRLVSLGRWQMATTALGVVVLLLVAGLPLFVLVWNAFLPYPQSPSFASIQLLTTKNFAAALDYEPAKRAVLNSLLLGLAAGLIATVLGALIAWCSLRLKTVRRAVALADQLATAPLAIPGMIFGVGLAWMYLVLPVPIYGTLWILLLAYVALHLPFAVRICTSGLAQLHPELEEAGAVAGAGWLTRLWRIVLRLAAPSLAASVLYVALRSFREYAASIFLTAPGTEVFAVLVLDMWEGGNSNILSAYVTMVMALISLGAVLASWLGRRLGVRA